MLLASLLALAITWIGLTIAFYTPYPVSFLISALAFLLYVGTLLAQWSAKLLLGARGHTGAAQSQRISRFTRFSRRGC
jgi:hypothetical protein